MSDIKLSADEMAFFESTPDDTPLEDNPGDPTPHEDDLEPVALSPDEAEKAAGEPDKPAPKDKEAEKPAEAADKGEKKPEKAEKEPEKQRMVPHGALESERQRRKAIEAERQREQREWAERQARLDERLSIINDALNPKSVQPDPNEDPIGYFNHSLQQVTERLNSIEGMSQQQREEAQRQYEQQRQYQEFESAYRSDAAEFAAQTPDFMDAYQHVYNSRVREYQAAGYSAVEAHQAAINEEQQIAWRALSNGSSAAETIYNLAKLRGWQGAPSDASADKAGQQEQADQPAETPEEAKKPNGDDKIAQLERAQAASKSLSDAGGSPGGNKITLESLDRMPEDEFKQLVAKLNKADPHGYDKFVLKLHGVR